MKQLRVWSAAAGSALPGFIKQTVFKCTGDEDEEEGEGCGEDEVDEDKVRKDRDQIDLYSLIVEMVLRAPKLVELRHPLMTE